MSCQLLWLRAKLGFRAGLTLITQPLGDGAIKSTGSLSQMLQPLIIAGGLGLRKGKILSGRSIAEEPLHRLDPANEGGQQEG